MRDLLAEALAYVCLWMQEHHLGRLQGPLWAAHDRLTGFTIPKFEEDPIARHFGFVDGVDACEVGPDGTCALHGWRQPDFGRGDG